MEAQHPLTIQSWYRPRRLAFFVPFEASTKLLATIVQFNLELWGGRHNPIIITDGKVIGNYFWNVLRFCSPDLIYSFVDIELPLLERIGRDICPQSIKRVNEERPSFDHSSAGGNLPNSMMVGSILQRRSLMDRNVNILKISAEPTHPYYDFLLFNFGLTALTLDPFGRDEATTGRVLGINFPPDYIATFLNSLRQTIHTGITPTELAEASIGMPLPERMDPGNEILISVGDSPHNIIYHWNHIFFESPIQRKSLAQFWIPSVVLSNKECEDYLIRFLSYLDSLRSQNLGYLRLISFDFSSERIDELRGKFREKLVHFKSAESITWENAPLIKPYDAGQRLRNDPAFVQQVIPSPRKSISPSSVLISLPPNPVLSAENIQGSWMVDQRIELHPERYLYTNTSYWWRLPRRPGIGSLLIRKPNRINRFGEISITITSSDKVATLNIPSEFSVFWRLLRRESYQTRRGEGITITSTADAIEDVNISDKGKYLQGIVSLFGGLFQANSYFAEPYWRECFEYMASGGRNVRDGNIGTISRVIENHLPGKKLSPEDLGFVSRKIARSLPETNDEDNPVTIDFFYRKSRQLNEELLGEGAQKGMPFIASLGVLREQKDAIDLEIQELVDSGVMLLGVRPRCPNCGSHIWYPMEVVRTTIQCIGCNQGYRLPIESKYFYKLNSLVVNGVARHGIVANCTALYDLLRLQS